MSICPMCKIGELLVIDDRFSFMPVGKKAKYCTVCGYTEIL